MKNKYFVIPNQIMNESIPNVEFVYPLTSFCVGLMHTITWEEIPDNAYLYINRMLGQKEIEELKSHQEYLKKLKGIFFEDLGVYQILKESQIAISKIFFASHANCSSITIASLLKDMDFVVASPDITLEELKEITSSLPEKVIVYTFGPLPYLYSRRTLIKNYELEFQKPITTELKITEPMTQKKFILKENEYGTVCYDQNQFDGRELFDLDHVFAYFLNLDWLEESNIVSWFQDFENGKPISHTTTGFLHQKTIYQLPPRKEEQK